MFGEKARVLVEPHLVSRARAATIHLILSAITAIVVVMLMFFLWYPQPYFLAMGGATLLLLMVGVDVALGPIITLLIFDQRKRLIKFDMAVVVLLQVTALFYGATIMFQARPAFIVYYRDRFDVVTATRIPMEELARVTTSHYKSIPLTGPELVALSVPDDGAEVNRMMFESKAASDFTAFPQHYLPYASKSKIAGASSRPVGLLRKKNPQIEAELATLLKAKGIEELQAGFLPLNTKANDMAVILERESGSILGMIFCDPW